jgi:hypothetical protein
MKKLLFLIILMCIAVKLKAQQKSTEKPLDKFTAPDSQSLFDTVAPKLSIKPKTNPEILFLPRENLAPSHNLIASLDRMPIAKPVGKWNMPIVKPDGTTRYNMPVKMLPPIIKTSDTTAAPRFNP